MNDGQLPTYSQLFKEAEMATMFDWWTIYGWHYSVSFFKCELWDDSSDFIHEKKIEHLFFVFRYYSLIHLPFKTRPTIYHLFVYDWTCSRQTSNYMSCFKKVPTNHMMSCNIFGLANNNFFWANLLCICIAFWSIQITINTVGEIDIKELSTYQTLCIYMLRAWMDSMLVYGSNNWRGL